MPNHAWIKGLLWITLFTFISLSKAYKEENLKQFLNTNQCLHCDLSQAIIGIQHEGAVLYFTNLREISSGKILGPDFRHSNLQFTNFSDANLYAANFSYSNLTGAKFDNAYLRKANFFRAEGVNLNNAADICDAVLPDGSHVNCHQAIS